MRAPRDLHRTSTRILSTALLVLGVAMIVVTVAAGGGPLATGVLLGLLFAAAGAGRLWVTSRS
ncbi:MAG TPA: hypothetical protein VHF51_18640 [Solirubrobacteraceae bacterium]|nr:hypothetical protein [Solirubrobacteraceae bacterium]